MASENVKVEKIHNTNTITELKSILKVNEISLDLHRFIVKSREIQLKIQNDINSFKLHADLSRLDELRLKKDDSLVKFFYTLNELKLELKKAAILIAEMRKLSDPLDISANKENTEQINKKLRALTNRLFCTTSHVKWSYALLKPQLENESSQRKLIASLLLTHLQKETVAQPASALKQEHDSQSRKTPYLSDLILEMNTMISKISLKSTDGVPASKPSMFAEQQPIFKAGPTSIQSDTETPSAGISINSETDIGAKQMTSSLSSTVPEPTKAPNGYFKFEMPSSKTFDFKLPGNNNKTSTLQANGLPSEPQLNNIEAKYVSKDSSASQQGLQERVFNFTPPLWPFELKQESSKSSYTKPTGVEPTISGTACVKFRPHIIVEEVEVNGKSVNVVLFHRCITMLKEYENKSLEELRFEDYFRLGAFEKRNNFLHRSVLNAEFKALDAVHVKFHPTTNDYWTSEETEKADRYQSINFMDEFKNRSFEELRLGDYIMARIFHPETFGGCTKALNAVHVKFHPSKVIDPTENENSKFQCITVMDEFRNKSFEELRLLDYVIARVLPPEIFSPNGMGTARVKFEPTTGIDILRKKFCTYVDINVKYQYINSIKEFENKSLEELRLEDYIAGRKGPSLDVVKHQNLQNSHSESLKSTPSKNAENETSDAVTKPINIENAANRSTTQTKRPEVIDKVKVQDIEPLLEAGKNEEAVEKSNYKLELDPENVHALEVRARAYYELKKYREALEDGQKAIGLLPKWSENGYICIVRCYLVLGQIALGQQTVRNAIGLYAQSSALKKLSESFSKLLALQERAHRLMSEFKYYEAVYVIDRCLDIYCPACFVMKLLKAECLAHMNKIEKARSIVIDTSLLRTDGAPGAAYADALYVFGLCFYCQEHDEMAIKYFRKVLENDPDHEKAMKMLKSTKKRTNTKLLKETKEKGNKAFNAGEYQKAMKFYNEALSIDKNNKQENAKLHYNRATVFAKQNQLRKAIDACTAALELDQNYIKPLLRRAQCYTEIKMYEEALEDYEKLYYIESTDEYKRLLKEANKKVMANRGPYYYYKVLGVSKNALMDDIIKAYRKLALRYHPDRHVGASHAELQINERKFKQMKEAYETLSEPRTRANYDLAQERNRAGTESEDESD